MKHSKKRCKHEQNPNDKEKANKEANVVKIKNNQQSNIENGEILILRPDLLKDCSDDQFMDSMTTNS